MTLSHTNWYKLIHMFRLILLSICFPALLLSQSPDKKIALENYRLLTSIETNLTAEQFFMSNKAEMQLGPADEMILKDESPGKNGWRHHRYEQFYKDVPIKGVSYILHSQDGLVRSANGSFLPGMDLDVRPHIDKGEAIQRAKEFTLEQFRKENGITLSEVLQVQEYDKGALCIIDQSMPDFSGTYALVYELMMEIKGYHYGKQLFVDAISGKIVKDLPLHIHQGVPGKGVTKYYGERDIIVDSIAPNDFLLRDPTRGENGINISASEKEFKSSSSFFDLTNDDQDEVAVDALFCTSRFYDMCRDELDWLGLDNNDQSMNANVHWSWFSEVNAAYNRGTEETYYTDGNCFHGPLTTLEVIGHEFMHGIIDHSSSLIYEGESGAINESLADVLGKYLEWYVDPGNSSWELGHSYILDEERADIFRNLEDPESVGNPSFYKGETWDDLSGVHSNSAIGNLFFVLLSDGRTGVNEAMEPYDVRSIGLETAAQFIFHINRHFLTEDSDYNDYYNTSLLAAEEFFQGDQSEINNIIEAWKAVGLPNQLVENKMMDLEILSQSYLVCENEVYLDVVIQIENTGDLDYLSSMDAQVYVSYDGEGVFVEEYFDITEDILIGESYEIYVDSIVYIESIDFTDRFIPSIGIRCELVFDEDQNEINDTGYNSFRFFKHDKNDLALNAIIQDLSCFNDSIYLYASLTNLTCTDLPANTLLGIILKDQNDEVLFEMDTLTEHEIEARWGYGLRMNIDLDLSGVEKLTAHLNFENDRNMEDNFREVDFQLFEAVDEDFFFEFETEDFGRVLNLDICTNNIVFTHQGSNQLGVTGFNPVPAAVLCENDILDYNNSACDWSGNISAEMELCADLDGDQDLVFDLTQYRNDLLEYPSIRSSSLKVSWDSDQGKGSQIIEGLEEGMQEEIVIPMPQNFNGQIDFKFLTHTGWIADDTDYDVQFMDNLRFQSESVSVSDNRITPLKIYPNPAIDIIYITDFQSIKSIRVSDISGKEVDMGPFLNKGSLDSSQLSSGLYFMEVVDLEGRISRASFVKLDK